MQLFEIVHSCSPWVRVSDPGSFSSLTILPRSIIHIDHDTGSLTLTQGLQNKIFSKSCETFEEECSNWMWYGNAIFQVFSVIVSSHCCLQTHCTCALPKFFAAAYWLLPNPTSVCHNTWICYIRFPNWSCYSGIWGAEVSNKVGNAPSTCTVLHDLARGQYIFRWRQK